MSAADVEKVKEQQLRAHEVNLKQNSYWVNNIAGRDQSGEPLGGIATYDQFIKGLTPKLIQDAAKKYFDTTNYVRFVLLPER